MNACLPRTPKWRKYAADFYILPFLAIFLSQSCWGEQLSLAPVLSSQSINWIAGPKEANLGTLASIKVPEGYRLTDDAGARVILMRMNNPVPDGLVGILTPDSGKWWMVLTFTDVGYVKGADNERLDTTAILKAVQKQNEMQNKDRAEQGFSSIVSVNWERPPVYNSNGHSLEWAFRAETQSSKTINDTTLLLGRRGVLEIITVQSYEAAADPVLLSQVIGNITFKEGQRYTDYENGDKIADVNLSQLVIDARKPGGKNLMASSKAGMVVWIYSGLAACGIMAGGALFYKKRRQRRVHSVVYANGGHAIAAAPALSSGNGQGNGHSNGHANGSVFAVPDLQNQRARSASDNRTKLRRRKVFDYSKFYTHVVMELSSKSNAVVGPALNGNGRSTHQTINHTNGTNHEASTTNHGASTTSQAITDATLDLIASQKNLIEEQKHLMQQQTGLIEERRKLIEEQNALLKRQAEMIESQYSLKLE